MAVKTGADAIVVSNHGGRQLDGAQSSISALPGIVDAVGSRYRGALRRRYSFRPGRAQGVCLGAKGTYIGRAFIYGLGAGGEAGVSQALDIILSRTGHDHGAVRRAPAEQNLGHHNLLQPPA